MPTTAELTAQISSFVAALASATDAASQTEAFSAFVESCARFYRYSPNNLFLIALANPQATRVAGYNAWRKHNRFVRKGEHGIPILAPCTYKADPDASDSPQVLRGFRVVYVFDVSQTDGEPLPEPPDWKSPEHLPTLEAALHAYAARLGITITIQDTGPAQGVSYGGSIALDPTAGTKTLIHELAHEILHHGAPDDPQDRLLREVEAEATAYAVARHFGLENLASPNYLALSGSESKDILARLAHIQKAALQIIQAVEPAEKEDPL